MAVTVCTCHAQRYTAEADEAQRVYKENIKRLDELAHQFNAAMEAAQQAKQVAPALRYCDLFEQALQRHVGGWLALEGIEVQPQSAPAA